MITQSHAAALPLLAGIAIGAVLGIFLVGFLMRLAVRIVARFTPSYGTVYVAMILGSFASIATGFVLGFVNGVMRLEPPSSMRFFVAVSVISFVAVIAVYGQVIKAPNSEPLGFLRALLVYSLQLLLAMAMMAGFMAACIGIFGYQRVVGDYRQRFAAYNQFLRSLQARGGAGFHFPANPWGANLLPSVQATPAPADRYYLKTPLVVRVSYGTITLPAQTEVQLIDQIGDSCRIEFAGNTYTISRSDLEAAP